MFGIKRLAKENCRLSLELKQRMFELSILYEIANSISYTLDYDDLFRRLIDSLHQIVDYDICTFLILSEEENKNNMVMLIAHPVHEKLVEEIMNKAITTLNTLRPDVGWGKRI